MSWLGRRRRGRQERWFDTYAGRANVVAGSAGGPYTCPCCGHLTLPERGGYDICRECGWEDDGQDDHDADVARGGPNERSLADARAAYLSGGGTRGVHRPPCEPS